MLFLIIIIILSIHSFDLIVVCIFSLVNVLDVSRLNNVNAIVDYLNEFSVIFLVSLSLFCRKTWCRL